MCQVGRVGDLRDNDEEHAGPAPHQGVQPGGEVIRYTTIVSNLEKSSQGTLPRCPTWRKVVRYTTKVSNLEERS